MNTASSTLLVLRGLEGNAPPELSSMQESLLTFLPLLERMWWVLWLATIAYITINYVIVPLITKVQQSKR